MPFPSFILIECRRRRVPTTAIIPSKAFSCRDLYDHNISHCSRPWLSILRQISSIETDNLFNSRVCTHLYSLD